MWNFLKKLFGIKKYVEVEKEVDHISILPEACSYSKQGEPGPSVEIEDGKLVIYPNGVSEFPITEIHASAEIKVLERGQYTRELKEVEIDFLYHSIKDDDFHPGHASHVQDEDGSWKWEITYFKN